MRTRYSIIFLLTASLFASCNNSEQKATNYTNPIAVDLKTATRLNSNTKFTVSGKVQSVESASLSTRVMGTIENIYTNVGDKVKKGTLLLSIDASDIKAQVAQAEAGAMQAEANYQNVLTNYNRFKNLFDKKSATQKELDDIATQLSIAKARWNAAKQSHQQALSQLPYAELRAPFDGVVTAKNAKKGDLAKVGFPLLIIENPNTLEVVASISETNIHQVDATKEVNVEIPSLKTTLKGKIKELSPSANHSGGQYLVTIQIETDNSKVLSGMYAKVYFEVPEMSGKESVFIDKKALIKKGQLTGIYTVSQQNTALLRWIELGEDLGDQVEVISGLSDGENYIIAPEVKLFNGIAISKK